MINTTALATPSKYTATTTPRRPPHYTLTNAILSSGAQSQCIVAMNKSGSPVVIKLPTPGQESAMRLESTALKRLEHPRIVRLLDTIAQRGHSLVLEYAPHGDLMNFLLEKAAPGNAHLPEALSRTLFMQLLQALQHCTKKKILHRDVKPENIFLDANYCIKLGDFGLASTDDSTEQWKNTSVGTSGYMSPEVHSCRYDDNNDGMNQQQTTCCHQESSDVWSTGVVLFVMLYGVPPFGAVDSINDWWYNKIFHGQWDEFFATHRQVYEQNDKSGSSYPQCTDHAKDIVQQMLNVDPSKRPSFEQLLSHPWFVASNNTTTIMTDEEVRKGMEKLTKLKSACRFPKTKKICVTTTAPNIAIPTPIAAVAALSMTPTTPKMIKEKPQRHSISKKRNHSDVDTEVVNDICIQRQRLRNGEKYGKLRKVQMVLSYDTTPSRRTFFTLQDGTSVEIETICTL